MKKNIFFHSKWSIIFSFILLSYNSYAGSRGNDLRGACNCRISSTKRNIVPVLYSDTKLLNLKPVATTDFAEKSVVATQTAISITQSDYQNIAQNGNSWIDFRSLNASFSMNIGTANTSSAQTFTLPSNLLTYFTGYSRLDFINESSLDAGLQIAGADIAARRQLIDENDNTIYKYFHVNIEPDGVYVLGTSYDMYDEADDNFDEEADYEYLDAPLNLNDAITMITEEIDFETNVCLEQWKEIKTVNGYGSLILPNGNSVDCLRISIVNEKRTRANANDPFPVNPEETINSLAFITKQGYYFQADVAATSGTTTLSNLMYRFVQPTNTLEETNSVRINNDSKGITINATDDAAHSSAILDIQSNNKGVLIPRVTQANRPANPADGLIIYQIDGAKGLYVYISGTGWLRLATE